uniref:Uncharacterized protein n=1 Tax=uncultured Desulfobacterium sp. TaxID=201089 RepID=E1YI11_9BACT|nr:unknown protein [uncultured Desulfobacterium sp.]
MIIVDDLCVKHVLLPEKAQNKNCNFWGKADGSEAVKTLETHSAGLDALVPWRMR